MVFSSILFLFRFLPVAMGLYYLTPRRYKNLCLLLVSLVFYSWGEVRYFPIMIASILVDYIASNGIARWGARRGVRRAFLLLSVFFNLGMLGQLNPIKNLHLSQEIDTQWMAEASI